MWVTAWSTGFGALVTLFFLLFWQARVWAWQEFRERIRKGPPVIASRRKGVLSYAQKLQREADALGIPEQSLLWRRSIWLAVALVIACTWLWQLWALLCLIPAAFAAPLLYARLRARATRRQLIQQTRVVQMLLAFLLRAGATLSDTLLLLERRMDAPMKDKLREVNVQKRYRTIHGALDALGDSTGVVQLREFAALVSESERNGTPLAQAIVRSLQFEAKARDTSAAQRYGNVQLEVALYATLLIAMPGFGFAIYAMMAFALHLFGSWTF